MNIGWKDRADVTRVREELRKLGIEEEIIAIVDRVNNIANEEVLHEKSDYQKR